MMDSRNNPVKESAAPTSGGFFLVDAESDAQFDMNAEKYAQHQIELANRIEDLTGMHFWVTKPKFGVYDYNLTKSKSSNELVAVANSISAIPMYWEVINGAAELKYRTIPSFKFATTIIDAAKLEGLKVHTREGNIDCYIIWAFTDKDMFYRVNTADHFKTVLGRNTYTTEDLPHEYKPQCLIPMSYLTDVSADMFKKEN